MSTVPFPIEQYLDSSDLKSLRDFMESEVEQDMPLTLDYAVADLVADLDAILAGIQRESGP